MTMGGGARIDDDVAAALADGQAPAPDRLLQSVVIRGISQELDIHCVTHNLRDLQAEVEGAHAEAAAALLAALWRIEFTDNVNAVYECSRDFTLAAAVQRHARAYSSD